MSESYELHAFASRERLAEALAQMVAETLREALNARGCASLVVSGGSTPVPFFRALSRQILDWSAVSVSLADDRWVASNHEDSNERLVRETLLCNEASAARFVSLVTDAENPEEALEAVSARLDDFTTFDVVILGMGADGHTASLFPGSEALANGLDLHSGQSCVAVTPPAAKHRRISLTLPRLMDTRKLVLHLTGEEKWSVFERAARERVETELPIAAVLNACANRESSEPMSVFYAP
ncbi:MAG: 6-phosphogluconolactonase [Congregibacter sp.]